MNIFLVLALLGNTSQSAFNKRKLHFEEISSHLYGLYVIWFKWLNYNV